MPFKLFNNDTRRDWSAESRPNIRKHHLPGKQHSATMKSNAKAVEGHIFPRFDFGFDPDYTTNRPGRGYRDKIYDNEDPYRLANLHDPPYTTINKGGYEKLISSASRLKQPERVENVNYAGPSKFSNVYSNKGLRGDKLPEGVRMFWLNPLCAGKRAHERGMLDRLNRKGWLHGRRRSM